MMITLAYNELRALLNVYSEPYQTVTACDNGSMAKMFNDHFRLIATFGRIAITLLITLRFFETF